MFLDIKSKIWGITWLYLHALQLCPYIICVIVIESLNDCTLHISSTFCVKVKLVSG